jgi:cytochrome c-type biogenesis protein CcmH/NrfF
MISGFGAAIGAAVSGHVFATSVAPQAQLGASAWVPLWLLPVGLAVVTSVLWISLFPRQASAQESTGHVR